jgi:DNA-binding NarL/FixJ family response regulator
LPGHIRILLADDHELVRSAIACVLDDEPDFEVVGQASTGVEAITLVQRFQPDVIVMDVDMPRVDGVNATRLILGTWPSVRIVGLSMDDSPAVVEKMKEAGASAYVTKSSPMKLLLDSVRAAASSQSA